MPSVTIEARSQVSTAPASQRGRSASNADGGDFAALVDSNTDAASDPNRSQPAPPPAPSVRPNSSDNANSAPSANKPNATDKPSVDKPGTSDTQTNSAETGNEGKADPATDDQSDSAATTDTTTVGLGVSAAGATPPAPAAITADSASDAPASLAATAIARVAAETADTAAASAAATTGEATEAANETATAGQTGKPAVTETATETAASLPVRSSLLAAAAAVLKAGGGSTGAATSGETETSQDIAIPPVAERPTDVIKATIANRQAEPKAATAEQPVNGAPGDAASPEAKAIDKQGAPAHPASSLTTPSQHHAATDVPRAETAHLPSDRAANVAPTTQINLDFASQLSIATPPATTAPHAVNAAQLATAAATTPQVPVQTIAVEIAANVQIGRSRFEIRLDPPELGRIDVRLDVDRQGNVTSHLLVEKASTLDFLRRDAHQLERALQDAGLKTSDSSLQFSLRDQQHSDHQGERERPGHRLIVIDEETVVAETAGRSYGRAIGLRGGLDIRV